MNPPPLIAHVVFSLSTGGLENGLVNIINRIAPESYRHVIVCITGADGFAARITAPGVDIIQMHKREGHDIDFYRRLRRLLQQLRPAIVHSRNLAALETQLCGLGISGLRRVHGEHGREIGDVDGSNRKYLMFRRCMRPLIDRYIAVSRDLESWLITRVGVRPERVTQIYNGVDHERFRPRNVKPLALLPQHWRKQDDMLIVGTVGRLTPVKDHASLLHAAAILRREHPDLGRRLRLLLVGDGPLRGELEAQVAARGLEEVVWLAGDRQDVPDLLQLMDVFALPSLGEGISNTVLEAMASGLPVVATAVGGNLELVRDGENGALVPSADPAALSGAIARVLVDEAGRARCGAAAHAFVRDNFDWQRTVQSYVTVYDELLGRSTELVEGTG